MTLLFIDGFDHLTSSQLSDKEGVSSVNGGVNQVYGRWPSPQQGIRLSTTGSYYEKSWTNDISTVVVGMAINLLSAATPTYHASYPFIRFQDGNSDDVCNIHFNSNLGFSVYNGADSLLGSSSDNIIRRYHWEYLEVKFTVSDTVGEITIRVNETQVINLTSQDTRVSNDYVKKVHFKGCYNSMEINIDDFYVDTSTFHGNCRVIPFKPDSVSGTNNDFTASAGNKDECVDEDQSNEDTDYIYSDTLNHIQTFGITTGSLGTVKGIQLNNHIRLDQAGTRKITPICRSNSTNYDGSESDAIPVDWIDIMEIWETDPDDSNPWTQTKLEAAEFGLEITT